MHFQFQTIDSCYPLSDRYFPVFLLVKVLLYSHEANLSDKLNSKKLFTVKPFLPLIVLFVLFSFPKFCKNTNEINIDISIILPPCPVPTSDVNLTFLIFLQHIKNLFKGCIGLFWLITVLGTHFELLYSYFT